MESSTKFGSLLSKLRTGPSSSATAPRPAPTVAPPPILSPNDINTLDAEDMDLFKLLADDDDDADVAAAAPVNPKVNSVASAPRPVVAAPPTPLPFQRLKEPARPALTPVADNTNRHFSAPPAATTQSPSACFTVSSTTAGIPSMPPSALPQLSATPPSSMMPSQEMVTPARKLPGPAGELPSLSKTQLAQFLRSPDAAKSFLPMSPASPAKKPRLSDASSPRGLPHAKFTSGAWLTMLRKLRVPPHGDAVKTRDMMDQYSVAKIHHVASTTTKVPQMILLVTQLRPMSENALATLADSTGAIQANLHKRVMEEFGLEITVGAVVVLQKTSVFRPTARSALYLNVTRDNIRFIFPAEVGEGRQKSVEKSVEKTRETPLAAATTGVSSTTTNTTTASVSAATSAAPSSSSIAPMTSDTGNLMDDDPALASLLDSLDDDDFTLDDADF